MPSTPRRSARLFAAAAITSCALIFAPAVSAEPARDLSIDPGETLVLEVPGTVDSATLPVGWRVLTQSGTLRITAPRDATPGETLTLHVYNATLIDDLSLTVSQPETTQAPAQPSSEKSWETQLVSLLVQMFSFS